MGLTSVSSKVQKMTELAEKLYQRVEEVRARVQETSETVDDTHARIERMETELAEQRALLEAIATDHGTDLDDLLADVEAPDAPTTDDEPE